MSKPAQPHQVETRSLVLNAIILASYAVVRPILLDAPMARAPKSEAELDSAWAKVRCATNLKLYDLAEDGSICLDSILGPSSMMLDITSPTGLCCVGMLVSVKH